MSDRAQAKRIDALSATTGDRSLLNDAEVALLTPGEAEHYSAFLAAAHGGPPGDDKTRIVIEDGGEIAPAPTNDLEVGEVGLPKLVGRSCLVLELVGGLEDDEGWAVIGSASRHWWPQRWPSQWSPLSYFKSVLEPRYRRNHMNQELQQDGSKRRCTRGQVLCS